MTVTTRQLGPIAATMIVAGNMIGSGVYLLPVSLAGIGGVSVIGWGITMAGALLIGLTLVSLVRNDGQGRDMIGQIDATFGPAAGFVAAAVYWVQALIGNVAIALAVTGYLGVFFPGLVSPALLPGTTATLMVMALGLAWAGPRLVARFEGTSLALGLLPILLVALAGWWWFDPALYQANWRVGQQSLPIAINQSVQTVFWAFLGLESASAIATLLKNPARDTGIATLSGIMLAGVVYVLACTVIMGLIPNSTMAQSTAPFADAVTVMLGGSLALLVAGAAALKAAGTLSGWVLVTAEMSQSLDRPAVRDGALSLQRLAIHAVLMTAIVFATASPTLNAQFNLIINASVGCSMAVYAMSAIAALKRGIGAVAASLALAFCIGFLALGDKLYWLLALALGALALIVWFILHRAVDKAVPNP